MRINIINLSKYAIAVALIIFIYSFPRIESALNTPDEHIYIGHSLRHGFEDVNVYISIIKWGQNFGTDFENQYSTLSEKTIVMYPIYTYVGSLFKTYNPIAIYNVLYLLSLVIFISTVFYICSKIFKDFPQQVLTVLITLFGAGLGGMVLRHNILSADVTTPVTFFGMMQKPHQLFAMSTYILSMINLLRLNQKDKHYKTILTSSLLMNFTVIFYPYHLVNYYLLLALVLFSAKIDKKNKIKLLAFGILTTLPLGLFNSLRIISSNGFGSVTSPNWENPTLLGLITGYTPAIFFIIYDLKTKKLTKLKKFLYIWIGSSLSLYFVPHAISRYFLRALYFPLSIIVVMSIKVIYDQYKHKRLFIFLGVCVLALFFNLNTMTYISSISSFNKSDDSAYYIDRYYQDSYKFLDTKTESKSGIISGKRTGTQIPVYTLNKVYIGHRYQTPNSEEKEEVMKKFYKNLMDQRSAEEFLANNKIDYVFYGVEENFIARQMGPAKLNYEFLEPVFNNEEVTIYKVK